LTAQPLNAQPESGDAEEHLRRGSNKRAKQDNVMKFTTRRIIEKLIKSFQFIARGAVTEWGILESPIGISVTAETPDHR
jgi:hypothetical protein